MDELYSVDGDPKNYCHSNNGTSPGQKLGIAGNYSCDSPFALVESAFRKMKRVNPDPDFILWTGDSGPHGKDPEPKFDVVYGNLKKITKMLSAKYFPNTTIIPALGNHDTRCVEIGRAETFLSFVCADESFTF